MQGKCFTFSKAAACRKAGGGTVCTGHASCISSQCAGGETNSLCHPLGKNWSSSTRRDPEICTVRSPSRPWEQRQQQSYKHLNRPNTLGKVSSACNLRRALSRGVSKVLMKGITRTSYCSGCPGPPPPALLHSPPPRLLLTIDHPAMAWPG